MQDFGAEGADDDVPHDARNRIIFWILVSDIPQ
jgi:hypothetical protein